MEINKTPGSTDLTLPFGYEGPLGFFLKFPL